MAKSTTDPKKGAPSPIKQVTPEFAIKHLLRSMFYTFRDASGDPDAEAKLQQAFHATFGHSMNKRVSTDQTLSTYLEGPPGHGKTASFRTAAKRFVKAMRKAGVPMRYFENPTEDVLASGAIRRTDFVFTTVELGGEISKSQVGGLPFKKKIGDREYMAHLSDWRLAATKMARYGMVLLDDFPTASIPVQHSVLGLLYGGGGGDLGFKAQGGQPSDKDLLENNDLDLKQRVPPSSIYIGLAGNMGVRDGNKIFDVPAAINNRLFKFGIIDTIDGWCARAQEMYNEDELADCQVATFLQMHKAEELEVFWKIAEPIDGIKPQVPSPRAWDGFTDDLRKIVGGYGGLAAAGRLPSSQRDSLVAEIATLGHGAMGHTVATKLAGFYNELLVGAAPIAEDIIKQGKVDERAIAEKYGSGQSGAEMNFGYSLASSLATLAASEIGKLTGVGKVQKKELEALKDPQSPLSQQVRKVLMHYSYGLAQFVNRSIAAKSLDEFLGRMVHIAPEMFVSQGTFRPPSRETAVLFTFGLIIDNKKYPKPEHRETLKSSISTWGVFIEGQVQDLLKEPAKSAAPRATIRPAGQ